MFTIYKTSVILIIILPFTHPQLIQTCKKFFVLFFENKNALKLSIYFFVYSMKVKGIQCYCLGSYTCCMLQLPMLW